MVAAEKRALGLYSAVLLLLLRHPVAPLAVVVVEVAAVTFTGRNLVTLAPIIKDRVVPVDSIVSITDPAQMDSSLNSQLDTIRVHLPGMR